MRLRSHIGGTVFEDELRAELVALRAELGRLRLVPDIPRREIYSKAEAAVLLGGLSVRTLDRMIALGEITPCRWGTKPQGGIPRREIERLAVPRPKVAAKMRARPGRRPAGRSPKEEAAGIRALTKRRPH